MFYSLKCLTCAMSSFSLKIEHKSKQKTQKLQNLLARNSTFAIIWSKIFSKKYFLGLEMCRNFKLKYPIQDFNAERDSCCASYLKIRRFLLHSQRSCFRFLAKSALETNMREFNLEKFRKFNVLWMWLCLHRAILTVIVSVIVQITNFCHLFSHVRWSKRVQNLDIECCMKKKTFKTARKIKTEKLKRLHLKYIYFN